MWDDAWPSQSIQNTERSLDNLVQLVESQSPVDEEVNKQLAKLLVVRLTGYLEQVVDECTKSFLTSKASPESAAFGASWLRQGRNPTPGALIAYVQRFGNLHWQSSFNQLIEENDEEIQRELAYLVDRRNKIAHGESESVTVRKALELVDPVKTVARWFIFTLDPR